MISVNCCHDTISSYRYEYKLLGQTIQKQVIMDTYTCSGLQLTNHLDSREDTIGVIVTAFISDFLFSQVSPERW